MNYSKIQFTTALLTILLLVIVFASPKKALALTDNLSSSNSLTTSQPATQVNSNLLNNLTNNVDTPNSIVNNSITGQNAQSQNAINQTSIVNSSGSTDISSQNLVSTQTNYNGNLSTVLTLNPTDSTQQSIPVTINNVAKDFAISNQIDISSNSGNATVQNSLIGGNSTTGESISGLNIVNLVNSNLTASKSYIKEVNIYGNFNGNLTIPTDLTDIINQSSYQNGSPNVSTTSILNSYNLNSISGSVLSQNNISSGESIIGDSKSLVNISNYSDLKITGNDVLTVFVNVTGSWSGNILGQDTNNLTVGSGINQMITATPITNSSSTLSNNIITNNITLNSISGNATNQNNIITANTTSGNAYSSLNILNLSNVQFNLEGWYEILVVNVFGNWNGNIVNQMQNNSNSNSSDNQASVSIIKINTCRAYTYSNNEGTVTLSPQTSISGNSNTKKTITIIGKSPKISNFASLGPVILTKHNIGHNYGGIIAIVGVGAAITLIIIDRLARLIIRR